MQRSTGAEPARKRRDRCAGVSADRSGAPVRGRARQHGLGPSPCCQGAEDLTAPAGRDRSDLTAERNGGRTAGPDAGRITVSASVLSDSVTWALAVAAFVLRADKAVSDAG